MDILKDFEHTKEDIELNKKMSDDFKSMNDTFSDMEKQYQSGYKDMQKNESNLGYIPKQGKHKVSNKYIENVFEYTFLDLDEEKLYLPQKDEITGKEKEASYANEIYRLPKEVEKYVNGYRAIMKGESSKDYEEYRSTRWWTFLSGPSQHFYKKNRKKLLKTAIKKQQKKVLDYQTASAEICKPMVDFYKSKREAGDSMDKLSVDELYLKYRESMGEEAYKEPSLQKLNQMMSEFKTAEQVTEENVNTLFAHYDTLTKGQGYDPNASPYHVYLSKKNRPILAKQPKAAYVIVMACITKAIAEKADRDNSSSKVKEKDAMDVKTFGKLWGQADLTQMAAGMITTNPAFREQFKSDEETITTQRAEKARVRWDNAVNRYPALKEFFREVCTRMGPDIADMSDEEFNENIEKYDKYAVESLQYINDFVDASDDITAGLEPEKEKLRKIMVEKYGLVAIRLEEEPVGKDGIGINELRKARRITKKDKEIGEDNEEQNIMKDGMDIKRSIYQDQIRNVVFKKLQHDTNSFSVNRTVLARRDCLYRHFMSIGDEKIIIELMNQKDMLKLLYGGMDSSFLEYVSKLENQYLANKKILDDYMKNVPMMFKSRVRQSIYNKLGSNLITARTSVISDEVKKVVTELNEKSLFKKSKNQKMKAASDRFWNAFDNVILKKIDPKQYEGIEESLLREMIAEYCCNIWGNIAEFKNMSLEDYIDKMGDEELEENMLLMGQNVVKRIKYFSDTCDKKIKGTEGNKRYNRIQLFHMRELFKKYALNLVPTNDSDKDAEDLMTNVINSDILINPFFANEATERSLDREIKKENSNYLIEGDKFSTKSAFQEMKDIEDTVMEDASAIKIDQTEEYTVQNILKKTTITKEVAEFQIALRKVIEEKLLAEKLPFMENIGNEKELENISQANFDSLVELLSHNYECVRGKFEKIGKADKEVKPRMRIGILCGDINSFNFKNVLQEETIRLANVKEAQELQLVVKLSEELERITGTVPINYMKVRTNISVVKERVEKCEVAYRVWKMVEGLGADTSVAEDLRSMIATYLADYDFDNDNINLDKVLQKLFKVIIKYEPNDKIEEITKWVEAKYDKEIDKTLKNDYDVLKQKKNDIESRKKKLQNDRANNEKEKEKVANEQVKIINKTGEIENSISYYTSFLDKLKQARKNIEIKQREADNTGVEIEKLKPNLRLHRNEVKNFKGLNEKLAKYISEMGEIANKINSLDSNAKIRAEKRYEKLQGWVADQNKAIEDYVNKNKKRGIYLNEVQRQYDQEDKRIEKLLAHKKELDQQIKELKKATSDGEEKAANKNKNKLEVELQLLKPQSDELRERLMSLNARDNELNAKEKEITELEEEVKKIEITIEANKASAKAKMRENIDQEIKKELIKGRELENKLGEDKVKTVHDFFLQYNLGDLLLESGKEIILANNADILLGAGGLHEDVLTENDEKKYIKEIGKMGQQYLERDSRLISFVNGLSPKIEIRQKLYYKMRTIYLQLESVELFDGGEGFEDQWSEREKRNKAKFGYSGVAEYEKAVRNFIKVSEGNDEAKKLEQETQIKQVNDLFENRQQILEKKHLGRFVPLLRESQDFWQKVLSKDEEEFTEYVDKELVASLGELAELMDKEEGKLEDKTGSKATINQIINTLFISQYGKDILFGDTYNSVESKKELYKNFTEEFYAKKVDDTSVSDRLEDLVKSSKKEKYGRMFIGLFQEILTSGVEDLEFLYDNKMFKEVVNKYKNRIATNYSFLESYLKKLSEGKANPEEMNGIEAQTLYKRLIVDAENNREKGARTDHFNLLMGKSCALMETSDFKKQIDTEIINALKQVGVVVQGIVKTENKKEAEPDEVKVIREQKKASRKLVDKYTLSMDKIRAQRIKSFSPITSSFKGGKVDIKPQMIETYKNTVLNSSIDLGKYNISQEEINLIAELSAEQVLTPGVKIKKDDNEMLTNAFEKAILLYNKVKETVDADNKDGGDGINDLVKRAYVYMLTKCSLSDEDPSAQVESNYAEYKENEKVMDELKALVSENKVDNPELLAGLKEDIEDLEFYAFSAKKSELESFKDIVSAKKNYYLNAQILNAQVNVAIASFLKRDGNDTIIPEREKSALQSGFRVYYTNVLVQSGFSVQVEDLIKVIEQRTSREAMAYDAVLNQISNLTYERKAEGDMGAEEFDKFMVKNLSKDNKKIFYNLSLQEQKAVLLSLTLSSGYSAISGNASMQILYNTKDRQQKETETISNILRLLKGEDLAIPFPYSEVYEKLRSQKGGLSNKRFANAMEYVKNCVKLMIPEYSKDKWSTLGDSVNNLEYAKTNIGLTKNGKNKLNDINSMQENLDKIKDHQDFKASLTKMLKTQGADELSRRIEKMTEPEIKKLVVLLQNRTILDKSTDPSRNGADVNPVMRKQLLKKMGADSSRNSFIEKYSTGAKCQIAMTTLYTYQIRDDVDIINRGLRENDLAKDALTRKTAIDLELLKNALDTLDETSYIEQNVSNAFEFDYNYERARQQSKGGNPNSKELEDKNGFATAKEFIQMKKQMELNAPKMDLEKDFLGEDIVLLKSKKLHRGSKEKQALEDYEEELRRKLQEKQLKEMLRGETNISIDFSMEEKRVLYGEKYDELKRAANVGLF